MAEQKQKTKAPKNQPDKKAYTYDIECYPNLICATFLHVSSEEKHVFVIFGDTRDRKYDRNDYVALVEFLRNNVRTLIGYNNQSYDDTLLKHLMLSYDVFKDAGAGDIAKSCNILSGKIINDQDRKKKRNDKERNPYLDNLRSRSLFGSLDLLLLFNTIERVGLKQIAINLRWPEIIDLPFEPSHIVMKEEIEDLLYYNLNDVLITKKLLIHQEEEIKLRKDYGAEVKQNVMNANRTNIAKFVIRKYYTEETKTKFETFRDKRSFHRGKMNLGQCISKKITFMSPPYQAAFNSFRNAWINPLKLDDDKKKQFEHILHSKVTEHTLGLGGIHSTTKGIVSESATHALIDIDVESFYPRIMINERLYPAHLGPELIKVYRDKIFYPRIEAKRSGNKLLAEVLKIALNSTFGLTKSIYSWMYDPKVTLSITVSGQLYLMMLMERLEIYTHCEVVYSNTDGLTVKVPRNETEKFRSICGQWEEYTGFKLEYNNVKKVVVKDVNNFMLFFEDPKKELKDKGVFLVKKELKSGYVYPIVSKALYEYFTKGTNPELFIKRHTDIYDFMAAVRTSQELYEVQFRSKTDPTTVQVLQKSNRWIVTKGNPDEGRLIKYSLKRQREENLQKGYMTTLMNNLKEVSDDIGQYRLDYDFYIKRVYKVIKAIKHTEMKVKMKQASLL